MSIDGYSIIGTFILAGFISLFGVFAVMGEVTLRYHKLKGRLSRGNQQ